MRGLVYAVAIGLGVAYSPVQAKQDAIQKNNAEMMRLGAATAVDLLGKESSLCFSRAMFVIRGYELREKQEQLRVQLEGDFKSLPEEYKRLLLQGANMSKLDVKELSTDFDKCVKKATEGVNEAFLQ